MSAVLPIEEDDRFEIYTASSGQKTFAVPFLFQDDEDIGVYYQSSGSWQKIAAASYVLTGAGEAAGGSVTLNTGRLAGEKVLVIGEASLTRLTSVARAGKFSSQATDDELDRNVIVAQELRRELSRALRMERGASGIYEVAGDIADGDVLIVSGGKLIGASLAFIADETDAAAVVIALAAKADLSYVNSEIATLDALIAALDASKAPASTAVTLTGAQTLTNKVLDNPDIIGPVPSGLQSIAASVAANAMTLTINPCTLDFRSDTLANGTPVRKKLSTALSLTIPSGATLGMTNALQACLAVLLLNDGGTLRPGVVNIAGAITLDEMGLISATAISAGATSRGVVYSSVNVSNATYRLVGLVFVTEATAGTWATAPSKLQPLGGAATAALASNGYGRTPSDVTASRTAGTTYYTSDRRRLVEITLNFSAGGIGRIYKNGQLTQQPSTVQADSISISTIVQPWSNYSVSMSGVASYQWTETDM